MEALLKTFLKTVDIEGIAKTAIDRLMTFPQIEEMLALGRDLKSDFETIKSQNLEILAELDSLKKSHDDCPPVRHFTIGENHAAE